ncbi:MAG: FtsX-like permease family protein [Opitutae bacterium]|nr:FtsX-like permease family protein [Opitutae bacterium]
MLQGLRPAVFAVDKDQPVSSIRPLAAVVADTVSRQRFVTVLLALFATVALAIAAVGIYGVTAYSVSQRTTELGVRLALGASPAGVLGLVLRQGLGTVGVGLALGAAAALALGRIMESLLFQTSARDPLVFAGLAAALAAVALLACWLPARRAARTDPMVALRAE